MADIFVIWNGDRSRQYATAMKTLLELALNAKCFMSEHSIHAGSRWMEEVAAALMSARFGLVCATFDMIDKDPMGTTKFKSEWPHFEFGALFGRGVPVAPILFDDMTFPDVGPLMRFQHAVKWPNELTQPLERTAPKLYGLLQDIDRSLGRPTTRAVVKGRLPAAVSACVELLPKTKAPPNSSGDAAQLIQLVHEQLGNVDVPATVWSALRQAVAHATKENLERLAQAILLAKQKKASN